MDLPNDLLHDVFRRVPPQWLAACRRVRKTWRAVIDGSGILFAHLAPRPPRGIFINYLENRDHNFFCRASPAGAPVDGSLGFVPHMRISSRVLDHRNGLVLCQFRSVMYVCNPATLRWATVPPPPIRPYLSRRLYLLFDPTVSLHYDVLFFPDAPARPDMWRQHLKFGNKRKLWLHKVDTHSGEVRSCFQAEYEQEKKTVGSMEWPPSSYALQAFSSRTGQWEERLFTREGGDVVTTTVSDIRADPCSNLLRLHAVYWQGKFYLHCRGGFVMRFSFQEKKYLTIKTPELDASYCQPRSSSEDATEQKVSIPYGYLGKSKHGVYYTIVHMYKLSVWVLQEASEACRRMPLWELKHEVDLEHDIQHHKGVVIDDPCWILDPGEEGSSDIGGGEDKGWDSDNDDRVAVDTVGIAVDHKGDTDGYHVMDFLGYHPCKEIVFLSCRDQGFAYYLGSSKLQYLGLLDPPECRFPGAAPMLESFVYTPCMDDLLTTNNAP